MSSFCGAVQEHPNRQNVNRTLSDITNITNGQQSANKRPLLDPKTPARRTKIGSSSGLSVFDDGAQSVARQASSPPRVQPKSRGIDQDGISCESRQMLEIEEVNATDLPPIQDFADRASEQEQYWHALGLDDGPDGFGRPEDLAHMLAHGPAGGRLEMEPASKLWSYDFGECEVSCPDSAELNRMAWQSTSMSPSPKCKLAEPGFGALGLIGSASPLFPPMDLEMDIDSGSEAEHDRHSCVQEDTMMV